MRLIPLVCLLVWLILGYFYKTTHDTCCHGDAIGAVDKKGSSDGTNNDATANLDGTANGGAAIAKAASGPILFNYAKSGTVLGDDWGEYKAKLLANFKPKERMEITGRYTSDEAAPKGYADMGEARADAAREALGLSKDRVILKSVMTDKGVDKENPYEAVSFSNIGAPKSIEESIDNKTIIRFPYNSTNKLSDSAVEDYLDKVAKRVKASGERVRLVGHTDSDGADEGNMRLGQARADIIKRYLVSKGVSSNKIMTSSKGESQPIASNSTGTGKAENRRTELEIIK